MHEMAVRGIVEKDKNKIFQAILLDPLTSAVLTIDEITPDGRRNVRGIKQYLTEIQIELLCADLR